MNEAQIFGLLLLVWIVINSIDASWQTNLRLVNAISSLPSLRWALSLPKDLLKDISLVQNHVAKQAKPVYKWLQQLKYAIFAILFFYGVLWCHFNIDTQIPISSLGIAFGAWLSVVVIISIVRDRTYRDSGNRAWGFFIEQGSFGIFMGMIFVLLMHLTEQHLPGFIGPVFLVTPFLLLFITDYLFDFRGKIHLKLLKQKRLDFRLDGSTFDALFKSKHYASTFSIYPYWSTTLIYIALIKSYFDKDMFKWQEVNTEFETEVSRLESVLLALQNHEVLDIKKATEVVNRIRWIADVVRNGHRQVLLSEFGLIEDEEEWYDEEYD